MSEAVDKLRELREKTTPGQWRTESVSDAVRIIVGKGRQKWILARLATKQIPEAETQANADYLLACTAYVQEHVLRPVERLRQRKGSSK